MNDFFLKYKDMHKGETGVLFGTGPTLDKYKPIKEKSILVGVNHIGKRKPFDQSLEDFIMLDYYFFGDRDHAGRSDGLPNTSRAWEKEFKVKKEKFCATIVNGNVHPQHYTTKEALRLKAKPFAIQHGNTFPKDISKSALYSHTIIMPALQFLLYAGVSKIYIVGCDLFGNILHNWLDAKKFIKKEYPHVEIISVNPVGLKGVFIDMAQ